MIRRKPSLQVWGALPAPTLLIRTFMQKFMIIIVHCKIGSVKVISILESLETPKSVRLPAVIDIYADMRDSHTITVAACLFSHDQALCLSILSLSLPVCSHMIRLSACLFSHSRCLSVLT